MATYDDGLYRPDAWQETPAAPAWTPEQTTTDWAALATSSISSAALAAPVTASSTNIIPTAAAVTRATSSSSIAMATPLRSTSSSTRAAVVAPSSSSSSLSSSSLESSSASLPTASANSDLATAAPTTGFLSMKEWLIPVIVVAPIILGLLILGCMYGKCWGKKRQPVGEEGVGWFGGAGSLGRRRRDIDEDGALVGGEKYEDDGDLDDFDEKAAYAPQRRWSTLMRSGLGRGLSHSSSIRPPRRQRQPAASKPSDQPFLPPSQSHYDRSFSDSPVRQAPSAEAWNYGQRPAPTASAAPTGGLLSGWGTVRSKYRGGSASSRGSVRSLSDKLFGRGGAEEPPSPSCYSPENGAYAGLDGEEEGEMKDEDLNEYLAESRMGDSRLARRLMGGDASVVEVPHSGSKRSHAQQDEQYPQERYFARHPVVPPALSRETSYNNLSDSMAPIGMPTPPRPSHVSPTKTSVGSALLRPQTSATPPAKLLFSYDSPPVHSTYQAPAYPLVSPERAPASPRPPLPRPPQPQQPNFGQRQPHQFERQIYPSSQPDLFFAAQPPPPQPLFRQSALQKSDSDYSLSGGQDLVFGSSSTEERPLEVPIAQPTGQPKQRPISPTKEPNKLQKRKSQPRLPSTSTSAPVIPARSTSREWNKADLVALNADQQPQSTFNPVFSEPPPLAPLQHPSRVRNAIHNLEAATKVTSPPVSPVRQQPISHTRSQSNPYTSAPPSTNVYTSRPLSYPVNPSPQRVTGGRTTYSRPIKSGSDDEAPSQRPRSHSHSRSKSVSGSEESGESGESLRRTKTSDSMAQRPLSSDPRRLSQMLRRPSQGAGLGRPVVVKDDDE